MTIQIIKIITFLTTAPLITLAQKGRYRESEYYNNLQGTEATREELENWFYEIDLFLDKFGKDSEQVTEEEKSNLCLYWLTKAILDQAINGITDSLHFSHWLQTKTVSSKEQKAELRELIGRVEQMIRELESKKVGDEDNLNETDYEVINKEKVTYEKEKEEKQKLLMELKSRLESLSPWISRFFKKRELKQDQDHSYDEFVFLNHCKKEWVKETPFDASECQSREIEKLEQTPQQAQILQQEAYNVPGSWPVKKI